MMIGDMLIKQKESKLSSKRSFLDELGTLFNNKRLDRKTEFIKLQYHLRNYIIRMVETTKILKQEWK